MRYMGSKARWYVEPFVGGFNMIDKVPGGPNSQRYKALLDGWVPPDFFVGFVG